MQNLENIDLSVSENNQNNFTNILIVIVICIAVWMIYNNYFSNKNNKKETPSPVIYQETPVLAPTKIPESFNLDNLENIKIIDDDEEIEYLDDDNEIENFENLDDDNEIENFENLDDNQIESFVNMNSANYELVHDDTPSPFNINNMTLMVDQETETKTNCNIVNSDLIKDYKKKYFGMYAHQMGCSGSEGCNQSTDANSMNFYTLEMNKNKSCATCVNSQPILDRPEYNKLSKDVQAMDNNLHNQQQITQANVSNFVNFENNVYQNSIGETSVDKMAEIRTSVGTCGLNDYGTTIAQVYDNLLATVAGEELYDGNKDPNMLGGILEDASFTNNYQSL